MSSINIFIRPHFKGDMNHIYHDISYILVNAVNKTNKKQYCAVSLKYVSDLMTGR